MSAKVLIVDDSISARFFIRSCLPDTDLEVREAGDGMEGLTVFRDFQPDVTFIDLTMPVMDGFQALQAIREISPDARVVVLTADVQKKTVERILSLGAFLFLKKPPRKEEIQAALGQALEEVSTP